MRHPPNVRTPGLGGGAGAKYSEVKDFNSNDTNAPHDNDIGQRHFYSISKQAFGQNGGA